jgi:serine/threonine protein kinase
MFTGKPPWHNLQHLQLIYRFYLNEQPQYTLPNEVSANARNFLSSALNLDYQARPSAEALLQHEFLS